MLLQELHVNISKIAVTWWIMLNQFSQFLEDLTSGTVLKKKQPVWTMQSRMGRILERVGRLNALSSRQLSLFISRKSIRI